MSTSEILSTISLVSFVLAGISFLFAVFFWIRFNIPAVIGDLSGRTARKSIEKMRADNEKTGNKSYKSSKVNLGRGKVTEMMPDSDKATEKLKQQFVTAQMRSETGLLDENRAAYIDSRETELLSEQDETALLNEEILETELLQMDVFGTKKIDLLVEKNEMGNRTLEVESLNFVLLEEVMLIHTNEVI